MDVYSMIFRFALILIALSVLCINVVGQDNDTFLVSSDSSSESKTSAIALPETLYECETYTAQICGTWVLDGDHFNAEWDNGARATINIETWNSEHVAFTRYDVEGSSAELSARYDGQLNGDKIEYGFVTWTWGASTWSGTWNAHLILKQNNTSSIAVPEPAESQINISIKEAALAIESGDKAGFIKTMSNDTLGRVKGEPDLSSPVAMKIARGLREAKYIQMVGDVIVYEVAIEDGTYSFTTIEEDGKWKISGL
jgi:hypothetical protein